MEVEQEPLKNLLKILSGRLFDVDFDPDEFQDYLLRHILRNRPCDRLSGASTS